MGIRTTYQTYLMHSDDEGATWEKLRDVKSTPALGGPSERVQMTTQSDPKHKYLPGVEDITEQQWICNYSLEDDSEGLGYQSLLAMSRKDHWYAVWYGGNRVGGIEIPTGDQGKYPGIGQMVVWPDGGEVNSPQNMIIQIETSTPFELNMTP